MSDYSIQVKTTDTSNKTRTTTLSNVNPEATPATLIEFAQRLNLLTTNTYNQTDYIVKTNLDTETPPTPPIDVRPTPTLTVDQTPSAAKMNGTNKAQVFAVTYSGDGNVYSYMTGSKYRMNCVTRTNPNFEYLQSEYSDILITPGSKMIFGATGTDNYKPVEIELTVEE